MRGILLPLFSVIVNGFGSLDMPEGPEILEFTRRINDFANGRVFESLVKSSNHRSSLPERIFPCYTVSAKCRGKEFLVTMIETDKAGITSLPENLLYLLFAMGMSGHMEACKLENIPKHAHLQFISGTDSLCYVDTRRFGSWEILTEERWSPERGPDPFSEYDAFRAHVLESINEKVFEKPICEVLLNQAFFNGVGNYLRAEILCRAGIPPFISARNAIESTAGKDTDVLLHCHTIIKEVIDKGLNRDYPGRENPEFQAWLRCYSKGHFVDDGNKRRIWFWGPPGPLLKGKWTKSQNTPPQDLSVESIPKPIKQVPVSKGVRVEKKRKQDDMHPDSNSAKKSSPKPALELVSEHKIATRRSSRITKK